MLIYDRLCLMCPTYKRHDTKLPHFIDSAIEKASDPSRICFSFVVNAKDEETQAYLKRRFANEKVEWEIILEHLDLPHLAKYFNMAYDQTRFSEDTTAVSMLGDDMIFVTEHYDTLILQKLNDICGVGMVYCDDDHIQHESLCVNLFTTRRFVGMTRKPFMCPWFPIDWIDNVWMEATRNVGCANYMANVVIRHDHVRRKVFEGDDVWKRGRKQAAEAARYQDRIPEYTDEIAGNVKAALEDLVDPAVACVMATYDRVPLLYKFVARTYEDSVLLPPVLDVYDDGSTKADAIAKVVKGMRNAVFHPDSKHLACNNRYAKILREKLESPNVQAVMVIDSDTMFSKYWYIKLMDMWREFKNDPKLGAISLFDAPQHKRIDERCTQHLVQKRSIGGFGVLLTRRVLSAMKDYHDVPGKTLSWDNEVNAKAASGELKILLPGRSYLQHMGHSWGHHHSDTHMGDYAPNFVAEVREPIQELKRPRGNPPRDVLWASMARLGDVIMSSMIANMLVAQGVKLTWLVIPKYSKLVRRIAPHVDIIEWMPTAGPQAEWSETTAQEMKEKYPGHQCYINAQIGSREHHDAYIRSGKHPCVWLREHVESLTGATLPTSYRSYLRFDGAGVDLGRSWSIHTTKGPLAIIGPDAQTSQAIGPEKREEIFRQLQKEGYHPVYLIKNPPQNVPLSVARNHYLWHYDEAQCIEVIRQAALYVGQDSGLSWCALYSDCAKRIYHLRARVNLVNTQFQVIDKQAEDIVL